MFLYSENLVSDALKSDVLPWDFKPGAEISAQIRKVKEDRQDWYKSETTKHHFYTGTEPLNPNLRINKEQNPPIAVHAFVADYDVDVPDARIDEAIAKMPVKPAWVERSLGGNFRLVWILPFPFRTDGYDFTVYILQEATKWLNLAMLPGLDEPSFVTATRLYCNGCEWRSTQHGPVSEKDAQAFFIECGKSFRFNAPDDANVPLDIVEAALKVKFPSYTWPGPFELESQGPSFWVPGSTSPQSAIVKPGGMFSFSAHAERPFYPWSAILGPEFVAEFVATSLTKATKDIYYDGKNYWRLTNGLYESMSKEDCILFFKVDCRLSAKPGSDGTSPIDTARQHIHNHNRVRNAAPFVFRKPGPLMFMNERRLNTYCGSPVLPAPEPQTWGPDGGFPWFSYLLDTIFDPSEIQKVRWLAWFKYYYLSALNWTPLAGQYVCLSGGVGCGKTFISRRLVGTAVGGYADASDHLVDANPFNSHLLRCPHWCLDDDTPSNTPGARSKAAAMFKKMTGNQQFTHNEKFQVSGMVEWMGRVFITTNLDFTSLRILGSMDNNALDKMCLFKCVDQPTVQFPPRYEGEKIYSAELPKLLRWLVDWEVPDDVPRDNRYGFAAYHNPYLLERTHQGSAVATFKELLVGALKMYFMQSDPGTKTYSGSATEIHKLVMMDPNNVHIMRSYKPEQVNRYLEQLQSEKLMTCEVTTGLNKSRVWTFTRDPDTLPPEASPIVPPQDPTTPNPFSK